MSDDIRRQLDELFSGAPPTMTRGEARELFGDYGDVILELAAGTSEKVVRDLSHIDTPVSSNLLHHVAAMEDVTSERLAEVPYDQEHPTGEDIVVTVHRCEGMRVIARNELLARGRPDYDPEAFRSPGC